MISPSQLDSWLGKSMTDICLNGYDTAAHNHCAHFVAHVLNLHFGYTCRAHVGGTQPGANLRVQEIFARCPSTHEIRESTAALSGLIFVSHKDNFVTSNGRTTLKNVPKKHIGILLGGLVWHYSNSRKRVVKQPMSEFLSHYPGQDNALWFGSLPAGARAISYGQC